MFRMLTRGVLIAALVACAAPAFAQPAQTGTISGQIQGCHRRARCRASQ